MSAPLSLNPVPNLPPGLLTEDPAPSASSPPDGFEVIFPAPGEAILDTLEEDTILPDGRIVQAGARVLHGVNAALQARWSSAGFWTFLVLTDSGRPARWVHQHSVTRTGSQWEVIPDAESTLHPR